MVMVRITRRFHSHYDPTRDAVDDVGTLRLMHCRLNARDCIATEAILDDERM